MTLRSTDNFTYGKINSDLSFSLLIFETSVCVKKEHLKQSGDKVLITPTKSHKTL